MKLKKKLPLISLFLIIISNSIAQPDVSFYLPEEVSYNPSIPTPESVIGHEVGEFHVSHDRLVNYMKRVDEASDRISLEITGYTHEARPLLLLTITAPENHGKLTSIRSDHVQLTESARSANLNTATMPVVFYLGCSIHGNEASGSNAALLIAYYLAAAEGAEVEKTLQNTVILFDPSLNPDGLQRFSTWVNSRKSKIPSADPNDAEHHEAWPQGRTNHYWFDLNRDWLVGQQPESRARLKKFHEWKPNVLTDHHEMGTNRTFFFQPGVPSRSHPLTPAKNFELTKKMGEFHAKALDDIGSFYYTQEGYDDFYYGKGSTFPDVQGAVGILFEQASSRGHRQESENGILTFPFAIRNQFTAALSSLKAVNEMRVELLNYQREFFTEASAESKRDPVKAYLFGSMDRASAYHLAEILLRHDISVYKPERMEKIKNKTFHPESSFIVPLNQPQYKLLKAMFEKRTAFTDSLFYDISTWTLPLAAGVDFEELKALPAVGPRVSELKMPAGQLTGGSSTYAYVFESSDYYAPRAIYRLLDAGLRLKVATDVFHHADGKRFHRGAILIPVSGQDKSEEQINFLLREIVQKDGINVYAFHTGLDYQGASLGSTTFKTIQKPSIAMLVGGDVTAQDAGEMWHLLDTRFQIPVTLMPVDVFNKADIDRYNVLIFPQGNYAAVTGTAKEKLIAWVQKGGVAIGFENAINWFHATGLGKFELRKTDDTNETAKAAARPYALIEAYRRAQLTSGAIFEAKADLTHPLLYGYVRENIPLFKGNNLYMEQSPNSYANPLVYTSSPLLSGYISRENFEKIKGASAAGVSIVGRGRVVAFTENLAFRAFWFGTNKLLMNAIFYGALIDAHSGR